MPKAILRAAKFIDIPEITRLAEAAHRASRYAGFSHVRTDAVKQAALQWIGLQGEPDSLPRGFVVVAEADSGLEGMLVGVLTPLYDGLDIALGTDLIWYTETRAHATTGLRLMRMFQTWAEGYPGHVVLRHGVTDAIAHPERTGRLFEREGFRRAGTIYEKEILK